MILDIINEIKDNEDILYKADINEFEKIYKALELEEYSNVKDLALEQIQNSCFDPRYVIYAIFSYWYKSTNFDINSDILNELISIHQFYFEKVKEEKIRLKPYIKIVDWLHFQLFQHAQFIKKDVETYFEGDKYVLDKAFDEYISFIKSQFEDINITQLHKVKDLFRTIKVKEVETNKEEVLTAEASEESTNETLLSLDKGFGNDQWYKLLCDIQIYRKLINEESWLKAAVVYQVINKTLKEFDPVKYFPDTFYPYLKDTANAYDHLMHQLSLSQHPLWLLLSSMFDSDPESFSSDESLGTIGEILAKEVNNFELQPEMHDQDEEMMANDQSKTNW